MTDALEDRVGTVSIGGRTIKHLRFADDIDGLAASGMTKTILQGTVRGARRRGSQRKRWEDNIKEWTGMDFSATQRAADDRKKWRQLISRSSVVPKRHYVLRD